MSRTLTAWTPRRPQLAAIAGTALLAACSLSSVTFTPVDHSDSGLPDEPRTATITVTRAGAAAGTVSAQAPSLTCGVTCTATVSVGTTITLIATPDPGSVFAGWSGGGCAGTEPTCTLTVTEDTIIAARFDVAMFTVDLGLLGNGAGTVMSTPGGLACPGTCAAAFPYNTTLQLAAAANAASTFTGWGGPCSGTGACSFTVTADTTVMAGFALNHELIVMRAGNGTGAVSSNPAGISCGNDCAQAYAPGTVITLTATPAADSTFTGWSGGGCSGTGTCQVTIDRAIMVTASFALQKRTLQVSLAGAGTGTVASTPAGISCSPDCAEPYDIHTKVTLTASPAATSTFTGWSGGGCSGTGTCIVTLDNSVAVTATFALKPFVLTVNRAGSGTGSVQSSPAGITCGMDCAEPYSAGTIVTLTATASAGSTFVAWSGACSGTGTCQVTMSSDLSVTATFAVPGNLFAIDDVTRRLQRIDAATRFVTDVGPLGVSYAFGDCAWHQADATLYMVDGRGAKSLYKITLATGAATLIGPHGLVDLFSLAYHPPTKQLYGIAGDRNLYTISTTNGAATLVGPTGITVQTFVDGLAWDSRRNMMVALTAGNSAFLAINLSTGAATQLQSSGFINNLGMTYDPAIDRFWVVDHSSRFIQFDPNTSFTATELGPLSGNRTCLALVQ